MGLSDPVILTATSKWFKGRISVAVMASSSSEILQGFRSDGIFRMTSTLTQFPAQGLYQALPREMERT
jgi:hypothetical protein